MQVGQKLIIEVTIHDGMLYLRPIGAGINHLRRDLWEKSGKICYQASINEPDLVGMVEFEFKNNYKIQRVAHQTMLGHLRIQRLSKALSFMSRAFIEPLNS